MFASFRSVLYLIAAVGLLAAAGRAADGWRCVRVDNFIVSGDAPEPQLLETARRLEEFRSALSQIYPRLKLETPGVPTHVLVFKDAAAYRPFRPARPDGSADDAAAGYFVPGDDVNYIVTVADDAAAGPKPAPTSTVFHEYTHLLVHLNFGRENVPPWVNEGVAEYFETFRLVEGKAIFGGRPADFASALNPQTVVDLETVFATDDAALRSGARGSRAAFYAEAWALVHFVLHAPGDDDGFGRLAALLTEPERSEKAVAKAFKTAPAGFAGGLLAYAGQAQLPTRERMIATRKVPAFQPAAAMTEAEANARMGDLLLHLDRRDHSAVYLKKALAAAPEMPAAIASMGLLLMRQDNFADGRGYLEKAISAGETNHFVAFNLAWALIRSAMNKEGKIEDFAPDVAKRIVDLLQRSIVAGPEFAESRRLLAFVKMVEGDDLNGAAELARKAIELEPGNDEHRLLLARILLRQEKYQDARAAAQKIAFLAADPRVRSEAVQIINAADAYFAARNEPPPDKVLTVYSSQPPLILKRSSVSEEEIARFEEDRVQNNLNRILPKPKTGERLAVGYIHAVRCTDDGEVLYDVTADGQKTIFASGDLSSLRMNVLTEGESTYKIECGARFGRQLTVLTYRPPDLSKPASRPELVGIAFVPANFRLKTPEEMAKARLVIVEDDTISSRTRRKP
jgi:tetratricopeptide (TPR) repeat protein